jgi:hypothetical protein
MEEIMITVVRSQTTQPGKFGEAVAWGKEIVAIVKRVTGKELAFCTSFGGVIGAVAWIGQYDSVGQVEDVLNKLLANREYMAAIAKAADLFVPGSGHDQLWRHV